MRDRLRVAAARCRCAQPTPRPQTQMLTHPPPARPPAKASRRQDQPRGPALPQKLGGDAVDRLQQLVLELEGLPKRLWTVSVPIQPWESGSQDGGGSVLASPFRHRISLSDSRSSKVMAYVRFTPASSKSLSFQTLLVRVSVGPVEAGAGENPFVDPVASQLVARPSGGLGPR